MRAVAELEAVPAPPRPDAAGLVAPPRAQLRAPPAREEVLLGAPVDEAARIVDGHWFGEQGLGLRGIVCGEGSVGEGMGRQRMEEEAAGTEGAVVG